MDANETGSPGDGSEELDAVVGLVRRLVIAARSGPHGPGTRRGGHRQANCESCHAVAQGYSFLAAMTNEGDSLATGDPEAGQPKIGPALILVP